MIEFLVELAIGGIFRLAGWTTREIRIVRATSRKARSLGFRLDRRKLRRALKEPSFKEELDNRSEMSADTRARWEHLLSPKPDADTSQGVQNALIDARLERLGGGSPAMAAKNRQDRGEFSALREQIDESNGAAALFETHLNGLLPLSAEAFRKIHETYPGVARLLSDVLNTADRPQRLQDWAATVPLALQRAPVDIFGALADLSLDFGDVATSSAFIRLGLERGLTPRPYWFVILANRDASALTPEDVRARLSEFLDYPLTRAMLLEGGAEGAIALLTSWTPTEHREDEHRRMLLAEILLREHRADEAIVVAEQTYEAYMSRAAALTAIRARVMRHELGGTLSNGNDLEVALTLAERARADREGRRLHSANELAWILRIRRLMSDPQGALNLITDLAGEESTRRLLESPEVAAEAAMLHAAIGDIQLARRHLAKVKPVAARRVEAAIAEREGRDTDARDAWRQVVKDSPDWNDKATAALRLAFLGEESDFINKLRETHAQIASEIALAAALFGDKPGAVAEARQMASSSRAAVDFLLMYYERHGKASHALNFARDAAQRRSDPDLWLQVARLEHTAGTEQGALSAAQAALTRSTPRWGRRRMAFQLMVEASSSLGDWHAARDAASQLLIIEPDDPSAAWALTYCLIRLNDLQGAVDAWRTHGQPEPYDTMSIDAWTELVREFGEAVGTPADGLRYATRFPTDRHIRERLIGAFLLGPRADGRDPGGPESANDGGLGPSDAGRAFQTLMANYVEDFPDGAIRMVHVDTDDLLGSLSRELGEAIDTADLDEEVYQGQVPRALAAEVHHREIATVAATMAQSGPVFAGALTDSGRQAVLAATDEQVVIDTTAACTLALLPEDIAASLFSCFGSVRASLGQQRDAHEATLAARRDSGLTIVPPRNGQALSVNSTDEEDIAVRRSLIEALESRLGRATGVSQTGNIGIPELDSNKWSRPGFEALGLALSSSWPLWADDRALVGLARGAGGSAFTTLDLIEAARHGGALSISESNVALATLLTHGYVGLAYTSSTWDLAITLASNPKGLLVAAYHADPDEVSSRVNWLLRLADDVQTSAQDLRSVVSVAASWVVKVAGSEDQASNNIARLCQLLLARKWMSSSTLPWCVAGLQSDELRVDAVSAMLHELFRVYELLSESADTQLAAGSVFELVSRLEAGDAARVRSAIVRGRFE